MRGHRKTRDEAIERILAVLAEHRGQRFKPSHLAASLQIGRERIAGLLAALQAQGKVAADGRAWFMPLTNGEAIISEPAQPPAEPQRDEPTWVVVAHAGRAVKITLEFTP